MLTKSVLSSGKVQPLYKKSLEGKILFLNILVHLPGVTSPIVRLQKIITLVMRYRSVRLVLVKQDKILHQTYCRVYQLKSSVNCQFQVQKLEIDSI